jgi:hypothetical protein
MQNNNDKECILSIPISEIIIEALWNIHYSKITERTYISSKHSPTICRPSMFLPTIETIVHSLSTTVSSTS